MFEWYENMSQEEKNTFTRVVNKLLSACYINKRSDEDRRDYYFIERNERGISEYLMMGGWELMSDENNYVYYVRNRFGYNHVNLTLDESIILLILRLIYEEKRREISLAQNVVITIGEVQERYMGLGLKDRPINKANLRDAVSIFKRFNIIDNLDQDIFDPECRLIVYPSILSAVRAEDIKAVYDRISSYQREGGETIEEAYQG
ncbi:DUF4194 domain-containing protein [Calorimonas adulescens]|nr:DUF4194 domain-containing protein [Calorimonas adulescens]